MIYAFQPTSPEKANLAGLRSCFDELMDCIYYRTTAIATMTSGKAKELQMSWNDQDYHQMRQLLRFVHSEQERSWTLKDLQQLVTPTMPYKTIWVEFVAGEILLLAVHTSLFASILPLHAPFVKTGEEPPRHILLPANPRKEIPQPMYAWDCDGHVEAVYERKFCLPQLSFFPVKKLWMLCKHAGWKQ